MQLEIKHEAEEDRNALEVLVSKRLDGVPGRRACEDPTLKIPTACRSCRSLPLPPFLMLSVAQKSSRRVSPMVSRLWKGCLTVIAIQAARRTLAASASHALRQNVVQFVRTDGARGMASSSGPYDAIIIGGGGSTFFCYTSGCFDLTSKCPPGPGGYVAAIKAAQLGLKVGVGNL